MIGNTKLVDYGIQTDKSDFRAHVCVNAQSVYVFKTSKALSQIQKKSYIKRPVFTNKIKTAEGFIVPWEEIPNINEVKIPLSWLKKIAFEENATTTDKGNKAVIIIKGMLKKGMFPIITEGLVIDDLDMQVAGFDITINVSMSIQV